MAAVNLPDNPANGTTQTVGGITYTYNSSKGYWTAAASSGGGGGGGASVTTDDSAPGSPSDGDLWYDTDDGGMFVYYQDADSSQWVEVIGSQGAPGAAGAAGADGGAGVASVYATVDALPTSGNTQGDMAHVTANNTLYFWNGSGWYKIALINTNPSISGVASAYTLANDGTATTVTITASDPEGLPITYSIASDTSGNTASVSQGTGASTNVFTITPSTNSAHAGSFTLTFRASDGVNVATAPATFTLQFAVQNSRYTTALITSVGANNAVNNSFDDKSTSDHTLTAANQAHQTTFSPYRHGGYSVYCDGNDAVKFNETSSDEFTFGTGDFTMEGWFWIDYASIGASGEHTLIGNNGTDGEMWFSVIGSTWGGPKYNFQTGNGSWANTVSSGANTVTLQEWVHLAVVRNSGTVNIYENGVSVASGSNTINIPNSNSMLSFMGRPQTYGQYAKGYIHDVRITKGTAVYTSNFTVPDEPMSAVTNTKLLAFRKPYIVDESASPLSSTLDTGDPAVEGFTPYDAQEYSAASHSGSISLDGTGDRVSAAASADFGFGTGDFTVEWWIYFNSISNYEYHIDMRSADNDTPLSLFTRTNLQNQLGVYVSNSVIASGTHSFKPGIWTHYAICKTGGYLKGYFNGKQDFSISCTRDYGSSEAISIGSVYGNNNYYVNGNMADIRVVKGTAVYTAEFTPPTAPLTAITNTKLLVQSTDAGIIDKAQVAKTVKLIGDTKSSTTYTKFLSSSMYFDGSGDYINLDDQDIANFGNKPFTVEGWLYLVAYPSQWNFTLDTRSSGSDSNGFCVEVTPSDFGIYAGENMCRSGSAFGLGAWKHWAYTRDASGNHKVFINGTQSGSTFTGSKNYTTNKLKIAAGHNGGDNQNAYMSDIRITKGLARYTSNFTAPTAALKG